MELTFSRAAHCGSVTKTVDNRPMSQPSPNCACTVSKPFLIPTLPPQQEVWRWARAGMRTQLRQMI